MYYDGRKALAYALRDLFQARSGISWCTETLEEVSIKISIYNWCVITKITSFQITDYVTSYTNDLVENSNLLNRLIELLEQLDISKEVSLFVQIKSTF